MERAAASVALLATVLIAGLGTPASSQSPPRASLDEAYRRLLAQSDTLEAKGRADSALALLAPAIDAARAGRDSAAICALAMARAKLLTRLGQTKDAEPPAREALGLAEALADTATVCRALRHLVFVEQTQGRIDEAAAHLERLLAVARAAGLVEHEAFARTGRARLAMRAGDAAAARPELERAIAVYRERGLGFDEAVALNILGVCLKTQGDMDGALLSWRSGLALARAGGHARLESDLRINLANLEFYLGDPGAALREHEEIYAREREKGNLRDTVLPACNVGTLRTLLGQYDAADSILQEAIGISRREGLVDAQYKLLVAIGGLREEQARPHEAVSAFREGLSLADSAGDAGYGVEFAALLSNALAAIDSGGAALALLEESAATMRGKASAEVRQTFDLAWSERLVAARRYEVALALLLAFDADAERVGIGRYRGRALARAGRCALALGQPDRALALLRRAAQIWESERGVPLDPEWREERGEDGRAIGTLLASLLLAYPADLPRAERVRSAFDAAQRSKARTLLERMAGPAAAKGSDADRPDAAPVTLSELQGGLLAEGELLIDAHLGPDTSLVFAVTRDTCRAVGLPGEKNGLRERLELYRTLLARPAAPTGGGGAARVEEEAGARIGQLLLGEVADLVAGARGIVFAPDGALDRVPLGALALALPGTPTPEPLLAAHEVTCVPSATLLATLRRRGAPGPRAGAGAAVSVLAVAGAEGGDGAPLAGAEREVRRIGGLYRGVGVRVNPGRAGRPVTEDDLARFDVLHIAAHTSVDDQNPWRSGIHLSSAAASPEEAAPTILRASRILSLRLPARLAVLSGCSSAGTRAVSGEGLLGLAAAFLTAGVPAIVATLWPVDDRATARLVGAFYGGLARGETVGSALRAAQLAVRADPATSHPSYWAGFVVIGDGEVRIPLERRPWGLGAAAPIAGGGLLALVAALLLGRRARRAATSLGSRV